MKNKRKILINALSFVFVTFEIAAFCLIHFVEINLDYMLNYGCIIAATVFALLIPIVRLVTARESGEGISDILLNGRNGNFIALAMLFTLLADYFLVVCTDDRSLEGVSIFLGTQLFIFLHIIANQKSKRERLAHAITRLGITATLLTVIFLLLGEETDTLSLVSAIYYANLLTSAIFAHRSGRGGIMLTIGLIFFALCDINVAISALDMFYVDGFPKGSLLYSLLNSKIDLIWLFYIPSQTLIPLSMIYKEK